MIYELVLAKSPEQRERQFAWLTDTYGVGLSPGGVASYLGITRQSVHNAMRRDLLDVIYVIDQGGEQVATLIPMRSVLAYEQQREGGRAPNGRPLPSKPQRLHPTRLAAV